MQLKANLWPKVGYRVTEIWVEQKSVLAICFEIAVDTVESWVLACLV